jgi:general stress protein 26
MRIFNPSQGFGSSLTEHEIKEFLENSKLNVHLGTVDKKNQSNIHPVWYYYDSLNDKLYVETSKYSKKLFNIQKDKVVYFCVDEPTPPYKGVRGKGEVRIHVDTNHNVPIAEKIMMKYFGNLEHPMANLFLRYVKEGDSVILEITPKYYSAWNTEV